MKDPENGSSSDVDPPEKLNEDDKTARKRSLLCATTLEEDCRRLLTKFAFILFLTGILVICVFYCNYCLYGVFLLSLATCMCEPMMNVPLWISLVLLIINGFDVVFGQMELTLKKKFE